MTAPKLDVQPGWRGTDPDGGTWVMLLRGLLAADGPYWSYVSPTGCWSQRKQEEAEAAGLVRLIPVVGYHYDERGEDVVPDYAAPAPLDPGNPEHLRQALRLISEALNGPSVNTVMAALADRADRLDREAAEAEQDAKDAHRAECIAAEVYASGSVTIGHLSEAALAGIRAGRAEREEEGQ